MEDDRMKWGSITRINHDLITDKIPLSVMLHFGESDGVRNRYDFDQEFMNDLKNIHENFCFLYFIRFGFEDCPCLERTAYYAISLKDYSVSQLKSVFYTRMLGSRRKMPSLHQIFGKLREYEEIKNRKDR